MAEPLSAYREDEKSERGEVRTLSEVFEEVTRLPGSTLPSEGPSIKLDDVARSKLLKDLSDILAAYDTAMQPRYKRWKEILDSYNLVPNPQRQGQKPDASRLVSEMTRGQTNIASARLVEGILGVRPFMRVLVWYDQGSDPDTQSLVEEAKATETFLDFYSATELEDERWIPNVIRRLSKLGTAVVYADWHEEQFEVCYRGEDGKFQKHEEETGRVRIRELLNENVVVWPLDETDISRMTAIGHRTYFTPSEFRSWAKRASVPAGALGRVLEAEASSEEPAESATIRDLKGKDIDTSGLNPYEGQIQVTELWCNMPLPETDEQRKFQVFLHESSGTLLAVRKNVLNAGRHPYFDFHYWREEGSFWSSGVPHELIYAQAGDEALMNMLIDNLKIIGQHLIFIRAGSTAEAQLDQVAPGARLVTENPTEDVHSFALGAELEQISQVMDRFEMRGIKSSGITPPLQGTGDPILKSGASPSSLQMLISEAGRKFGQVDRDLRYHLTQLYSFILSLLQQYAPTELFYAKAPSDKARALQRLRYRIPYGDLQKKFRISVEAPSATTNRELLKQNVMILYNQAVQHVQLILQLGQSVLGGPTDPRFLEFAQQQLEFVNGLFVEVLEFHDVPGVAGKAPMIPEDTPEFEQIRQLQQQVQQLTQQLQQAQQAMQGMPPQGPPPQMMGGPPGGAGMGPVGVG